MNPTTRKVTQLKKTDDLTVTEQRSNDGATEHTTGYCHRANKYWEKAFGES